MDELELWKYLWLSKRNSIMEGSFLEAGTIWLVRKS